MFRFYRIKKIKMADQEVFSKAAKVEILEKVTNKTRFYLEQARRQQELAQAETLLTDIDKA
jgi:hypothetical protein